MTFARLLQEPLQRDAVTAPRRRADHGARMPAAPLSLRRQRMLTVSMSPIIHRRSQTINSGIDGLPYGYCRVKYIFASSLLIVPQKSRAKL